jgi:hypothetical protein
MREFNASGRVGRSDFPVRTEPEAWERGTVFSLHFGFRGQGASDFMEPFRLPDLLKAVAF